MFYNSLAVWCAQGFFCSREGREYVYWYIVEIRLNNIVQHFTWRTYFRRIEAWNHLSCKQKFYSCMAFNFYQVQHAKKVVPNSPGLVDFATGLMNSVLNLHDGQVKFFGEFTVINPAHQ